MTRILQHRCVVSHPWDLSGSVSRINHWNVSLFSGGPSSSLRENEELRKNSKLKLGQTHAPNVNLVIQSRLLHICNGAKLYPSTIFVAKKWKN